MEKFTQVIIGDMEVPVFLGYYALAVFAEILSLAIRADNKRKDSPYTPDKFSWSFFFRDNLLKIFINLAVTALAIRFSNELVGQEITGWLSIIIGFTINFLVVKIQNIENSARS